MPKHPPFEKGNKITSKYNSSYIEKVDKYLKWSKDRSIKVLKQRSNEKGYEIFESKLQVKLPTLVGFAKYVGVVENTITNWRNAYPEFKVASDKIIGEQRQKLIDSGLSGAYNSTIAKLILSSNHGMKERVDNTTKDESVNNFNDEQINRIAERIVERRPASDGDTSV